MVNKSREIGIKSWHYRRLFWSIVVLFIFTSFIQIEYGGVITSGLLTVTILIDGANHDHFQSLEVGIKGFGGDLPFL